MEKNLICIGCPLGCPITAQLNDGVVSDIKGYTCQRGLKYAQKELTNPERTVTSSVKVAGGEINAVSVRTNKDIPKSKMRECIEELREIVLYAPVKSGDVIIKNVCGTDADVIATKSVDKI